MCVCRPEASKDGIKKAKAAVKKGLIRTIHPLIQGCDGVRCNSLLAEKAVSMYLFIYVNVYYSSMHKFKIVFMYMRGKYECMCVYVYVYMYMYVLYVSSLPTEHRCHTGILSN